MSDITPTDPTDDLVEPTDTVKLVKAADVTEGIDSHVAGHGEDD